MSEVKGKRKRNPYFAAFEKIMIGLTVAGILWIFITLFRGVMTYGTIAPIELDTPEKLNCTVDVFHIKDTNNVGSYTVSFSEGFMTIILNDVKDMRALCFENLAYYGITEDDYNQIVGAPLEEGDKIYSRAALNEYQGTWFKIWHNGMELKREIDSCHYFILLYEENDILYCEVSTGRDYDFSKKLASMD